MQLLTTARKCYGISRQFFAEAKLLLSDADICWPDREDYGEGHILIVRVDAIGDYMLFRQCLRGLRQAPRFQGKKITLCGNAAWEPLADALDADAFDAFIAVDRGRFLADKQYRHDLLRLIRRKGFRYALQPTFSREYIGDSLVRASGAPERVGFLGPAQNFSWLMRYYFNRYYTELIQPKPGFPFELSRNMEILRYLQVPSESIPTFQEAFPLCLENQITGNIKPLLGLPVFFLGASAAARRWPAERFAELARYVAEKYEIRIILIGGRAVESEMEFVSSQCPGYVIPVAETSLLDMIALIAHASLLVSNDSVGAHVGATYGVPTVIISNGQHQGRFHPYPDSAASNTRTVYPVGMMKDGHGCYDKAAPYPISSVSLEAVKEAVNQLYG